MRPRPRPTYSSLGTVRPVPPARPRLWTIQPVEVWFHLQSEGVAHVDPLKSVCGGWANPQYVWLSSQFCSRLARPTSKLLWWAYCERPDLRLHRHCRPGGSEQVLIELAPLAGTAMSFPCWAWGEVFFNKYLSVSARDEARWRARVFRECGRPLEDLDGPLPHTLELALRRSWERLFSPALPARCWRRGWTSRRREAVLDELRLEWVVGVRHFRGSRRSNL